MQIKSYGPPDGNSDAKFGNPDKLETTMGLQYITRFGSAAINKGRTAGTLTERDAGLSVSAEVKT